MDLERLFYPKSVAVIGASPYMGGGKLPYFQLLRMAGFKGDVFPVNPKYAEIDGIRSYASIDELPEGIDFAIIAAPAGKSVEVIKAAARRKIKFVHFFTSGFGETGNHTLERELVREARKGGTRIVGPNCIGIYSPEAGVVFDYVKEEDAVRNVACLSQSGGATSNFVRMAASKKVGMTKVVSYGNQIDIKAEHYLGYFADDKRVRLIAGYIEDIKEPRSFLDALGRATRTKPVVILKGGMTAQGARAAASHTGALASNHRIWSSAVRQHGGILVDTFERLLDVTMVGTGKVTPRGRRMGFLGAGGGAAVSFTDLAVLAGLSLPELSPETQQLISRKIRDINTSTTNPVDLGFYGFDFSIMAHTISAMARDDAIDVIVPYFSVDYIGTFARDQVESGPRTIIEMARELDKPVIPVLSIFSENDIDMENIRISIFNEFRKERLPVYSTIQDAIYAISKYVEWQERTNSLREAVS